ERAVLACLHPAAPDQLAGCCDLRRVLQQLVGQGEREGQHEEQEGMGKEVEEEEEVGKQQQQREGQQERPESLCATWKPPRVQAGVLVAPHLAARCGAGGGGGPEEATQGLMRDWGGGPVVVETKFDGWRIQLHVTGGMYDPRVTATPTCGAASAGDSSTRCRFHYYSRNCRDHGPRSGFSVLD
ncbi:hypothetical protein Agub_g11786, partial [Astrephomene gubernaculifera]